MYVEISIYDLPFAKFQGMRTETPTQFQTEVKSACYSSILYMCTCAATYFGRGIKAFHGYLLVSCAVYYSGQFSAIFFSGFVYLLTVSSNANSVALIFVIRQK